MPNRIFLDTSFVIALVNQEDEHHEQAEALSYQFENSLLVTTDAILLEIGNGLARGFREEALQIIGVLRGSKRVAIRQIDSELLGKGLGIYKKYTDKAWGLVDCISFFVMWESQITEVLTFDADFEQAGFRLLEP